MSGESAESTGNQSEKLNHQSDPEPRSGLIRRGTNAALQCETSLESNAKARFKISQTQSLDPNSLRPDAILTNPENIRCRVDRVESGKVYMTVLYGRTINGEQEVMVPVSEVTAHWTLRKAAA